MKKSTMKEKKTSRKGKKTPKFEDYKTSRGYIRALARTMKGTIIQHYNNYIPPVKEKETETKEPKKTDKEILYLFVDQVETVYKDLKKHNKLKESQLLPESEVTKKKWATKAGIKLAVKGALRSGGFANKAENYGQNVIETIKDAGYWGEFKDTLDKAAGKHLRVYPKNFIAPVTKNSKSQTVTYKVDGTPLVSILLTWSPATVVINDLVTESKPEQKDGE